MKIKKGDIVIVRTGKDRGKEGKVIRSFPKRAQILVEGINIVHRNQKARRRGSQGQIIEKPMPMPASNVALKGSKGKPVRVGYMKEGSGNDMKKIRIERGTGKKI